MNASHVSIKLKIVVEQSKTHFTTEQVYTADSVVEEGKYQRAVREAATKLLKMIREEGLEPQTVSAEIPGATVASDMNHDRAAFPERENLSPTALLVPSSSV